MTASASRADGDPASDYLLTENVYLPYRSPSPAVSRGLRRAADDVYARGDRVKVAPIYSVDDLGAIPSLFGRPGDYAEFLGIELGLWYVGPLLVVMPAGFGIYDGGRSTGVEEQVLRSIPISAGNLDDLARSATRALQRLEAADAVRSPDIKPPGDRPPGLRRWLPPDDSHLADGLQGRNPPGRGALAGPGEAPHTAASLLRRRIRPGGEPERPSLRSLPAEWVRRL
jgi:hypothetical protein